MPNDKKPTEELNKNTCVCLEEGFLSGRLVRNCHLVSKSLFPPLKSTTVLF